MFGKYQEVLALVVLVLLISTGEATLSVYNWQALGGTDSSLLNISYSIANYGFAPFGKTIIGRLVHSPKFSQECTPQAQPDVDYQNSFLLIPRGQCQFVTKTRNAQQLGAQMAIIMDDQQHKGTVIMADNGYGYKITIPSVFINFNNGEKLKKMLEDNKQSDVYMKITFDNEKTEKVDVKFYLQSNNRHSYRFVQSFRRFYPLIKDHINLQLTYSTSKCLDCPATDCYNDHNYCAFNLLHEQSATGRLILDQQIREQIVFSLYPDQWWGYMQYVGDECAAISEYQACQGNALKKMEIDSELVEKEFKSSFGDKESNKFLAKNTENLMLAGINRYPTVTLNHIKLRGNLHAEFVFDDICNTLSNPPKECSKYVESSTIFQTEVSTEWPTLVLVISLGILIFSLIFCFYRRYMKRKISQQMQGRVDDMVSKYIEFYSERNK